MFRKINIFGLLVVMASVFAACTWTHRVDSPRIEYDANGYGRLVTHTTIASFPAGPRVIMSACQADSQCGSGYCKTGYCQQAPRDGLGETYHIHSGWHDRGVPMSAQCEHDSPSVRGIEEDRGAHIRDLRSDRRGCDPFYHPGTRVPLAYGQRPSQVVPSEPRWEDLPPWLRAGYLKRDDDPRPKYCSVVNEAGHTFFDCYPWNAPYFEDGRWDYEVPEGQLAAAQSASPKDTYRAVFTAEDQFWLDGPGKKKCKGPGQGKSKSCYGPPYRAERGDHLILDLSEPDEGTDDAELERSARDAPEPGVSSP